MTALAKESPVVTVGIPCYNRPDGLKRTLSAITSQTYQGIEIIISDNCSPNPLVRSVAEEFAERDPRVTYIRQSENIGALQNFLFLADSAQGDFFMWAADDDWWAPEFIEETVRLLNADPHASLAFSAFAPVADNYSLKRRYPDFNKAILEFTCHDLCERMKRYIRQKEAYGKAHLIYGLFRRERLKEAIAQTRKNISLRTTIDQFAQFDLLLNAAVLARGHAAICQRVLRRFGSAPVNSGTQASGSLIGKLLRIDSHSLIYLDCYTPLIESLQCSHQDKLRLKRTLKRKKLSFYAERIGRRLLVYKIYWHFLKKLKFKSVAELAAET